MNTAELSFRVDPALKEQAAQLFQELGLSTSAALRLFLEHAVTCQGLPFDTSLNGDAENGLRNALWARDAERMQRNGDDRMVMPRKPGMNNETTTAAMHEARTGKLESVTLDDIQSVLNAGAQCGRLSRPLP